jgi:pyruvate formate lyase activating enzyme
MTLADILAIVMRDRDYYEYSGGGFTVSGGEPFVQADGINELLRMAKEEGLHTAVDTCGDVSAAVFKASLKNVDLFLFDVKHCNADTLKNITGADLDRILENLSCAVQSGRKVIARIPVIPGFNYDAKTLAGILNLAKSCGVREAHLLPYHTLGKNKYSRLGIPYTWDGYHALTKDELFATMRDTDVSGMEIKIGG